MILKEINGKLDDMFLSCIEDFWGFKLPPDYRVFMINTNGGRPALKSFNINRKNKNSSNIDHFFGFIKNKNFNILKYYKDCGIRFPNKFIAIANDTFGNLILISVKGQDRGKIYFWDHEMEADTDNGEVADYSNLTLIADSFSEFMNGLYEAS